MSAKIFSHFLPLPSLHRRSSPLSPLPSPLPCGFIWPVNSRGTIYTPDRFRFYHLHRSTTFFYSRLSFFFTLFLPLHFFFISHSHSPLRVLMRWSHLAIHVLALLSLLLLRRIIFCPSFLHTFFLSLFRRHVRRAKCTARDAHSPRSSEPRLESGEILIAPIGVRTYFPRRQRRVEGRRSTRNEIGTTRGPPGESRERPEGGPNGGE